MDFEALNEVITDYSELESPSFLQGMLVGLMCGTGEISETAWIKRILQEAGVKKVKESLLKALHELYLMTDKGLNGSGFELQLMLPDDEQDLAFRGALLTQWAEGFLYGFGLSEREMKDVEQEVKDFIGDVQEIARLDAAALNEEEGAEAENDLMEIIEFIRMGVLLVNETLNPKKGMPVMEPTDAQAEKATIH